MKIFIWFFHFWLILTLSGVAAIAAAEAVRGMDGGRGDALPAGLPACNSTLSLLFFKHVRLNLPFR